MTVPHRGERKGNIIAAVLGAAIAKSAAQMEVLGDVAPETLGKACELIEKGALNYRCKEKLSVKASYARLIKVKGKEYIVGSGIYLAGDGRQRTENRQKTECKRRVTCNPPAVGKCGMWNEKEEKNDPL